MILIIILAFQFYFLARVFKKNKLKTILTAVGMYIAGQILFAIILYILLAIKVIDIGIDINDLNANNVKEFSQVLSEYLYEKNITFFVDMILFLLIGIVYYNFLKRRWIKSIYVENEPIISEIKENIQKQLLTIPLKTDFFTHFHAVNDKNIHLIEPLAREIWSSAYSGILEQEQIDYMIEMMYNRDKILTDIENGDHWEILKADNEPVGYLHYKEEGNKIFLSKIYLKQDSKYKGLGQLMLNHVIDFAVFKNKNEIYLTVNKNNKKAIKFYEKNRFSKIKDEVFDIGNGYKMDDFILEKKINFN